MKSPHAGLEIRLASLRSDNRRLRHEIGKRMLISAGLKNKGRRFERMWHDSQRLQRHLRDHTHQILRAQEDQRLEFSHELQDGIAQTLLGIHVKLLALRLEAKQARNVIAGGFVSAEQLVRKSARSVRKVTADMGVM